jgi:hypothetical protein
MNNSNYGQISLVLRWLFISLNATQGFFIFLFHVLLKEDSRKFWAKRFKKSMKGRVSNEKGQKKGGMISADTSNYYKGLSTTNTDITKSDQLSSQGLVANSHVIENRSAKNSTVVSPPVTVSEIQMPEFKSYDKENEQSVMHVYSLNDDEDDGIYCNADELGIFIGADATTEAALVIPNPSSSPQHSTEPEIRPLPDDIYSNELTPEDNLSLAAKRLVAGALLRACHQLAHDYTIYTIRKYFESV